jgi:hypothetical protein
VVSLQRWIARPLGHRLKIGADPAIGACMHASMQALPLEKLLEEKTKFVDCLKTLPVCINTAEANEQHYEVQCRTSGSTA